MVRLLLAVTAALMVAALARPAVAQDAPAAAPAGQTEPKADEPAAAPKQPCPLKDIYDMPSLSGVEWIGPALDLDALYGQPVVLVFVESWCPKCNQWAGDFAAQVQKAAVGQPVTLVYLGVDMTKASMTAYAKKMGLEGHSMGVVSRPWAAQCRAPETLWRTLVVDAMGRCPGIGHFGMYRTNSTGEQVCALAADMPKLCESGKLIVDSTDTPELKNADLAVRLGMYGKAGEFLAKAGDAGTAALARWTERGRMMLDAARSYEAEDPYLAWRLSSIVGREFRKADYAEEARTLAGRLVKDKKVRDEQAADRALVKIEQATRTRSDEKALKLMLTQLALKYPACRGGRIAQRTLDMLTPAPAGGLGG